MGVKAHPAQIKPQRHTAMTDDRPLAFTLPAVSRKKVTAAFDGGRLSSDSGVMLLGLAERGRGPAQTFAALNPEPHPCRACYVLPGSRVVQPACVPTAEVRALNGGARRP